MNPRPIRVRTHPSLALIKYWGKRRRGINIPATSSLAVSLGSLYTETTLLPADGGFSLELDGKPVPREQYAAFLARVEDLYGKSVSLKVSSSNSFPSAAGLASSSSGFAALALGCNAALGLKLTTRELSSLARVGSGSAARAVYSGFTLFKAGRTAAEPFRSTDFWPELRIGIGIVNYERKKDSSRNGMNLSRETSPYFTAWVRDSRRLLKAARNAFLRHDITTLGECMRASYLRMFSTMLSSQPPLIYWQPETVATIRAIAELRQKGYSVWETMDAGPQVKFLANADQLPKILDQLKQRLPTVRWLQSRPGEEPVVEELEETE